MKDLALDVVQLSLSFGKEMIFQDISFQITKGEFVSVIGPNGSGKTSLIKIITGLYTPDTGHVYVYEPLIGYVPQHMNRDPYSPMTVRELLSLKMENIGFWSAGKNHEEEMKTVLKQTNIESVLNKQIKHLSGGQFQRLMIAYALIGDPGLLILDEPVSGIDVHGEQDFFDLIEKIHQEKEITIMMISHDIDIVYRYATQVICLNRSLVCHGVPSDVLTKDAIEKTFSTKHGIYHHQHQVDQQT